jgi:hypothetical protein
MIHGVRNSVDRDRVIEGIDVRHRDVARERTADWNWGLA